MVVSFLVILSEAMFVVLELIQTLGTPVRGEVLAEGFSLPEGTFRYDGEARCCRNSWRLAPPEHHFVRYRLREPYLLATPFAAIAREPSAPRKAGHERIGVCPCNQFHAIASFRCMSPILAQRRHAR
jgi:hypothetical protein